jgi:hypothetical protein
MIAGHAAIEVSIPRTIVSGDDGLIECCSTSSDSSSKLSLSQASIVFDEINLPMTNETL